MNNPIAAFSFEMDIGSGKLLFPRKYSITNCTSGTLRYNIYFINIINFYFIFLFYFINVVFFMIYNDIKMITFISYILFTTLIRFFFLNYYCNTKIENRKNKITNYDIKKYCHIAFSRI